jgi:hypothetical protein
LSLAIQLNSATRRQTGKSLLDLAQDLFARTAEDGSEPAIESELRVHVTDKIDRGETRLSFPFEPFLTAIINQKIDENNEEDLS